jgi:hypothetical protein
MDKNVSSVIDELVNKRSGIDLGVADEEVDLREIQEEVDSFSRIRSTRKENKPGRKPVQYAEDGMPDYRKPDQYGHASAFRWGGYGRPPVKREDVDFEKLRSLEVTPGMWWWNWLVACGLPYPLYRHHDGEELFDEINDIFHERKKACCPEEYAAVHSKSIS